MAKKNGVKAKTAKKATKEPKAPFRVMIGRVSKNGKKYNFEKTSYNEYAPALELVKKTLEKGSEDVREIIVLANPNAEVKA